MQIKCYMVKNGMTALDLCRENDGTSFSLSRLGVENVALHPTVCITINAMSNLWNEKKYSMPGVFIYLLKTEKRRATGSNNNKMKVFTDVGLLVNYDP
jgi:hypothetical protein